MPNQVVIITGSQRSGTTMLNLALDSHPDVVGIDEADFDPARMPEYVNDAAYAPAVCLKLPRFAAAPSFFVRIPGVRILWTLRDPRAVVASMIRLRLDLDGRSVPWAAHPLGAGVELTSGAMALGGVPPDLAEVWRAFRAAGALPPGEWPPAQVVTAAALCWRLKHELLRLYDRARIQYRVVVYENLVRHPEAEMRAILAYLGLAWHADVLRHHQLHQGMSTGQTDNTRPIDTASLDKWRRDLGPAEMEIVRTVCGARAAELGYAL